MKKVLLYALPFIICEIFALIQKAGIIIAPFALLFEIVIIPIYLSIIASKNINGITALLIRYISVLIISVICIYIRMFKYVTAGTVDTESKMIANTEILFAFILLTCIWLGFLIMYCIKKKKTNVNH